VRVSAGALLGAATSRAADRHQQAVKLPWRFLRGRQSARVAAAAS
jgi:hypothetical protein